MRFFLVVLVVCAVLGVVSWRRSGGSVTRYLPGTAAPLVWMLLGAGTLAAIVTHVVEPDGDLARSVFTGGLIGTGLSQVVLLRLTPRDEVVGLREGPPGHAERPDPAGAEPDG